MVVHKNPVALCPCPTHVLSFPREAETLDGTYWTFVIKGEVTDIINIYILVFGGEVPFVLRLRYVFYSAPSLANTDRSSRFERRKEVSIFVCSLPLVIAHEKL